MSGNICALNRTWGPRRTTAGQRWQSGMVPNSFTDVWSGPTDLGGSSVTPQSTTYIPVNDFTAQLTVAFSGTSFVGYLTGASLCKWTTSGGGGLSVDGTAWVQSDTSHPDYALNGGTYWYPHYPAQGGDYGTGLDFPCVPDFLDTFHPPTTPPNPSWVLRKGLWSIGISVTPNSHALHAYVNAGAYPHRLNTGLPFNHSIAVADYGQRVLSAYDTVASGSWSGNAYLMASPLWHFNVSLDVRLDSGYTPTSGDAAFDLQVSGTWIG